MQINFEEFRNYKVGEGYQHKNVIRQKTNANCGTGLVIKDMTGGQFNVGRIHARAKKRKRAFIFAVVLRRIKSGVGGREGATGG